MNNICSLSKKTLSYQLSVRPGLARKDRSQAKLREVVKVLNKVLTGNSMSGVEASWTVPSMSSPEIDALVFYTLNHAVSVVGQRIHRYDDLGGYLKLVDLYNKELAIRSTRLFLYLLVICTRESRHVKDAVDSSMMNQLRDKYGDAILDFNRSIKGEGSSGSVEALRDNPPDVTLGEYTNFLVDVFFQGKYSGGYGGKAWGKVAEVLRDYVTGVLSPEMMMDTGFTLAHNNGPIFNKGVLYESYTHEIYRILDVQRSGQIPKFIGNNETNLSNNAEVTGVYGVVKDTLPDIVSGYVDWYLVEELGAMKAYPSEKKKQKDKYGMPDSIKAQELAKQIKAKAEKKKKEMADSMSVFITPNTIIKKVEIMR